MQLAVQLAVPFLFPIAATLSDESTTQNQHTRAVHLLDACEELLSGARFEDGDRERVLTEFAQLKRRYSRPIEHPWHSISRQRRYMLGVESRRILRTWVTMHIEDPYPSMQEKQRLAAAANLTMKQVNDWFTNYRKRHWDDEIKTMASCR